MVESQPTLAELWDELRGYLDGRLVLAHNASFDISVLRNALDGYGIPYPRLEYSCTHLIAKETWQDWVRFSLPAIARRLNIDFCHHDATEDARACAEVALHAAQDLEASCFEDVEERTGVYRGRLELDHYCRPYSPRVRGNRSGGRYGGHVCYKDIKPSVEEFNEDSPFFQRKVVFTGKMSCLTKSDAAQIVVDHGGTCAESVSKKTNIVVVGQFDSRTLCEGKDKSSKLEKAESLAADGCDIEILSETEFLRMIDE